MWGFYTLRIQTRTARPPHLLYAGKPLRQYAVDAWAKIGLGRLNYISNNQSTIRAKLRDAVGDAAQQDDFHPRDLGRRIILPTSPTGNARYVIPHYHDALAITSENGRPTYLSAVARNLNWKEGREALQPCQRYTESPDLADPVFDRKKREGLRMITYGKILGAFRKKGD